MMDLEKRYYDEIGNACDILYMVKNDPEWAANRIQEGEKAARILAELSCAQVDKRKIIQITTDTDATNNDFWGISALCDDGTVWQYQGVWFRVPDIPQDLDVPSTKAAVHPEEFDNYNLSA